MAYALFLCNEAVRVSGGTALADCLHGNQGAPIPITSAQCPLLPWHLAETGTEESILRLSVSVERRAQRGGKERKWRLFLQTGVGVLLSAIISALANNSSVNVNLAKAV